MPKPTCEMVESERIKSGGMLNGRFMLRAIYRHFQLERDRLGMLAERNLLSIKMGGDGVTHLETFRDKYLYVATTIPVEDMPKESTLCSLMTWRRPERLGRVPIAGQRNGFGIGLISPSICTSSALIAKSLTSRCET